MSKKKKNKKQKKIIKEDSFNEKTPEDLLYIEIGKIVEGLYFMSETDAGIYPFSGKKAAEVSKDEILLQTKNPLNLNVEERDFVEFFARLIKIQDWYGEEEIANARKFSELKYLLERNLRDLKVFKIGLIEIDIYAVGLDSEDILKGIKTKAVET